MNNTFSLEQISKTEKLDDNLILNQYELDLMARFTKFKFINPKFKRNQILKDLGYSDSTLRRSKSYDLILHW